MSKIWGVQDLYNDRLLARGVGHQQPANLWRFEITPIYSSRQSARATKNHDRQAH